MLHYSYFIFSVYRGLNKISNKENIVDKFVSVIIPFRNEEKNIINCLKSIEEQEYDKNKYEIIFVDDGSSDRSIDLLNENILTANVHLLSLNNFNGKRGHKKAAVKFGIENAKGEIIITTDADCTHGKEWLKSIVSSFSGNTAFVSGPVEFYNSDSLFGKLQKLEFAGLIITGAGLIGNKTPIICNGANSAFRKHIFYEVGGYDDLMNLSSGEDELLMQKIASKTNYDIKFCMNRKAVVKTAPMSSLKEFLNQRKRWASKGLYYKNKLLIIKLILIFLFYLSIIAQILLGVFYNEIFLYTLLFTMLVKITSEYFVLKKGISLLFDKSINNVFLLAEIMQIPYIILSGLMGLFGNFRWKERELER